MLCYAMLISDLHSSTLIGCGGELNQSGKGMQGVDGWLLWGTPIKMLTGVQRVGCGGEHQSECLDWGADGAQGVEGWLWWGAPIRMLKLGYRSAKGWLW